MTVPKVGTILSAFFVEVIIIHICSVIQSAEMPHFRVKHCGVERHGSRKWDTPLPKEVVLIPGREDSIFINPFLIRA